MRRIKTDADLEKKIKDFYKDLFDNNATFSAITDDLQSLKEVYKVLHYQKADYIELLLKNLEDIAAAKPSRIEYWKSRFAAIIPPEEIHAEFHRELTATLKYKQLRKFPILGLYKSLGLNSCIYCNAQYNIVLDINRYKIGLTKGQVRTRKALFELDHFSPKSKYPFLSISFFNLLPSCSNCNKAKGKEDVMFYLFTEEDSELEVFRFELENLSIIKYWRTRNIDDLKLNVRSMAADDKLLKNHNKYFKLYKLYETQKDIAEELLHKKIVYSRAYKHYLEEDYRDKLFSDQAIINRLIIGNYDKPEEIHKRPMAKYTQDIAKQLGLI